MRSRLRKTLLAAGLSVLLGLTAASAAEADIGGGLTSPTPSPGYDFALLNFNSGLCLVVRGTSTNAPVVSTPCLRYDDQAWYATQAPAQFGSERFLLHNRNSGKCMLSPTYGVNAYRVVQTSCNSHFADQIWGLRTVAETGGKSYQFENYESNFCLVQRGSSSGAQAVTSGCDSYYRDQKWFGLPMSQVPMP